MSAEEHIADAESRFMVVNVAPDFASSATRSFPSTSCRSFRPRKAAYFRTPCSRAAEKVLMVDSIVKGVAGNAGSGVRSGVSLGAGNVKIISGSADGLRRAAPWPATAISAR